MNCEQFGTIVGMRCEPIPLRDGGEAISLQTPFTLFDGDGVELYAREVGAQVHLFDDGMTMNWLRGLGFKLRDDRRRWGAIRNAVAPYGVALAEDGCLEAYAPHQSASGAFARIVSAILAVDSWARENAGVPHESQWLAEEVALYLRAWKPRAMFSDRPEPLRGFSGRAHTFNMSLDGELIDAIVPHPSSTGGELRKLVDVRSVPIYRDTPIRVILDDRRDAEAAQQEGLILSSVAQTWTLTRLIQAAGVTHPAQ